MCQAYTREYYSRLTYLSYPTFWYIFWLDFKLKWIKTTSKSTEVKLITFSGCADDFEFA